MREFGRAVFKRAFTKPDGPRTPPSAIPSPRGGPAAANPHLRWHPLCGEWVVYTGRRDTLRTRGVCEVVEG